jgi:hypothetical protein
MKSGGAIRGKGRILDGKGDECTNLKFEASRLSHPKILNFGMWLKFSNF